MQALGVAKTRKIPYTYCTLGVLRHQIDARIAHHSEFYTQHSTFQNMHLSWLGATAIKIQAKPEGKDVTVLIDPYKPNTGSFPRSLTADIAAYTRSEKESITISGEPLVISSPGEWEMKSVLIAAVQGQAADHVMIRIDAEHMSLAHLGLANESLTDKQLDVLAGVDILFVPIGDVDCYGARSALRAVQVIEPRIVIPIAYKSDNDPNAKAVDGFIKEIGVKPEKEEKKVIIKKRDLPQEEMKVIVIDKE
jgi:L-ascorbate metabolism protein UlaG (beta-lactamase superfamily)